MIITNKKIVALALVILAVLSVLTACTNSSQNETTPATTAKAESSDSANANEKPTVEEQLKMLSAYKDTFKHVDFDNSGTPEAFYFAVTDLDNDGLVEIITSACTGTGLYTNSYFFEVHEKGRGIISCNPAMVNRESEPDIIVDFTDCYINEETGEIFYAYSDALRVSASESYRTIGWYTFRDNRLVYEAVATESIVESTPIYKSTDDEVITAQDFVDAMDNYFEGYKSTNATFGWTPFVNEDGVAASDLSDEEFEKLVVASYEAFSSDERFISPNA